MKLTKEQTQEIKDQQSQENKTKLLSSDVSGVKYFLYPDFKEISLYYKNIYPSTNKMTLILRRFFRNIIFNRHIKNNWQNILNRKRCPPSSNKSKKHKISHFVFSKELS